MEGKTDLRMDGLADGQTDGQTWLAMAHYCFYFIIHIYPSSQFNILSKTTLFKNDFKLFSQSHKLLLKDSETKLYSVSTKEKIAFSMLFRFGLYFK